MFLLYFNDSASQPDLPRTSRLPQCGDQRLQVATVLPEVGEAQAGVAPAAQSRPARNRLQTEADVVDEAEQARLSRQLYFAARGICFFDAPARQRADDIFDAAERLVGRPRQDDVRQLGVARFVGLGPV